MYILTELNARNDKRVDEMIEQGLIAELTQFHHEYSEARLKGNKLVIKFCDINILYIM